MKLKEHVIVDVLVITSFCIVLGCPGGGNDITLNEGFERVEKEAVAPNLPPDEKEAREEEGGEDTKSLDQTESKSPEAIDPDDQPKTRGQRSIPEGPGRTTYGYYTIGTTKIKIWLDAFWAETSFNQDSISQVVINHINTNHGKLNTHYWGDRYYYARIPEYSTSVWIICYYMPDQNTYGWAAIQNHGKWWMTANGQSQAWSLESGKSQTFELSLGGGYSLNVTGYNPPNENGWTSNDIWYKLN